ncbi:MAG: hypothetical protein JWN04_2397 [Myxococcaceae bacterium]|nr:hypothetical protein [Myxococcaceae bacterium]
MFFYLLGLLVFLSGTAPPLACADVANDAENVCWGQPQDSRCPDGTCQPDKCHSKWYGPESSDSVPSTYDCMLCYSYACVLCPGGMGDREETARKKIHASLQRFGPGARDEFGLRSGTRLLLSLAFASAVGVALTKLRTKR